MAINSIILILLGACGELLVSQLYFALPLDRLALNLEERAEDLEMPENPPAISAAIRAAKVRQVTADG